MIRRWISDIREKTADMEPKQAAEYVLTYYWYHILLAAAAIGLLLLCIYHIGWGTRRPEFTFVLVNQQVDYERDREIAAQFSDASGIPLKKISVDSDYLISYGTVEQKNVKESSYEKFFFNWAAGGLDAVLMPESFYRYCKEMGGVFADIHTFLDTKDAASFKEIFYKDSGVYTGIYADKTCLSGRVNTEAGDPLLLVFPAQSKHPNAAKKFLRFVFCR